MSQGVSEGFLVVDYDGDTLSLFHSLDLAREGAGSWMKAYKGVPWVKVYHLDFTTNKMTLIKEYRRRTESDEEGIVEYV